MKKPEEILSDITGNNPDYINVKLCLKAMKLYANAKLDEAVAEFHRLKPSESLRDVLYLDGVKAVLTTLKDKV